MPRKLGFELNVDYLNLYSSEFGVAPGAFFQPLLCFLQL